MITYSLQENVLDISKTSNHVSLIIKLSKIIVYFTIFIATRFEVNIGWRLTLSVRKSVGS